MPKRKGLPQSSPLAAPGSGLGRGSKARLGALLSDPRQRVDEAKQTTDLDTGSRRIDAEDRLSRELRPALKNGQRISNGHVYGAVPNLDRRGVFRITRCRDSYRDRFEASRTKTIGLATESRRSS